MPSSSIGKGLLFLLLIIFTSGIYYPTISNQKPVDIDYDLVIEPLKRIHSISDYSLALKEHSIVDVLPVRDLSLKIDLIIESTFGINVHGFFNTLFWSLSALVLYLIIIQLGLIHLSLPLTLLFLTHPLASWVVSWPSARKHILALFFISLATYFAIRLKKHKLQYPSLIYLCYLLSILSQPISLFWVGGFFLLFHEEIKQKKVLTLFYFLIVSGLIVGGANLIYYSMASSTVSGITKVNSKNALDIALAVGAISRSLSQIFYPFTFAYDYVKGGILTIIGLPTLVIFLFWGSYRVRSRDLFLLAFLIMGAFIIVYAPLSRVFVNDTYIILPLFFTVVALAWFMKDVSRTRLVNIVSVILVVMFSLKNLNEQVIANDERLYFEKSHEREPTCRNALPYAQHLLNASRYTEFKKMFDDSVSSGCAMGGSSSMPLIGRLYFYRILLTESISLEDKLLALNKMEVMTADLTILKYLLSELVNGEEIGQVSSKKLSPQFRKLVDESLTIACQEDPSCNRKKLFDLLHHQFKL